MVLDEESFFDKLMDINRFFDCLANARSEGGKIRGAMSPYIMNTKCQEFLEGDSLLKKKLLDSFGSGTYCEKAVETCLLVKNNQGKNNDFVQLDKIHEELYLKYLEDPKDWMVDSCIRFTNIVVDELKNLNVIETDNKGNLLRIKPKSEWRGDKG